MRLTKFNPETGEYEYIEKAKTFDEFRAQRKAVIQRLGELEDKAPRYIAYSDGRIERILPAEGEWECESGDDEYLCSNCKQLAPLSIRQIHEVQSAYCPWCGTKMKGEKR
jgi:DNA-directed RNA polymerase subunit RPC12/RpoP